MLVTNDDGLAVMARSLRNQGRAADAGWLAHARLGYNYRLSDINCALGIAQMSRLDEFIARRAQVANWYLERLAEEDRLCLQVVPPQVEISWFVFVVRLTDDYSPAQRDEILAKLRGQGIGCSNYFTPIHLQPFYREEFGFREGAFPVTEALSARTIALPFHNGLREQDVDHVVRALRALL
jgi:perosamine synthetase